MLKQYLRFSIFPLFFIVLSFIFASPKEIFGGIAAIIEAPDLLITDYFVIGGFGATFMNVGLVGLIAIWLCYFLKMKIWGGMYASIFMLMGFSMFGKNIANIWTIFAGVLLYCIVNKEHLSKHITLAFYGACLSPLTTMLFQWESWPAFLNVFLGIIFGLAIGFILPPLAAHLKAANKGYTLYNAGFTCGLIATIFVAIIKFFGMSWKGVDIWYSGSNIPMFIVLMVFSGIILVLGFVMSGFKILGYLGILSTKDIIGIDYIKSRGIGPTFMNIGINGIICTFLICIVGADLSGPAVGCIISVMGFSAIGKHIFNFLPIMFGVWLATLVGVYNITDHSIVIAFLLSTSLAPMTGRLGIVGGIAAGFVHVCVACSVGVLTGSMNLYNNGFAGGLTATFLVPIIKSIEDRIDRRRGHIEL